jgi:hypothetical protein
MSGINFSSTWGGKIYEDNFTTIRWNDYPAKTGEIVPISLKGLQSGYVLIEKTQFIKADAIPVEMLRKDLGRPATESSKEVKGHFFNLLQRFYLRKADWKGWFSVVQIISLKRVKDI